MKDFLQSIYDLYITGPRNFYRRNIHKFWERTFPTKEDDGSFVPFHLILGYAHFDRLTIQAERNQLDRARRSYDRSAERYPTLDSELDKE